MPDVRLNDPRPEVLDGRHLRASAFEPARVALLDDLVEGGVGGRALTVGAGYANVLGLLVDRGFDVVASDPSAEAVGVARQRWPAVEHRVADPTSTGLAHASFDLVFCTDTLEIVDDLDGVLRELARVIRPGGTVVLDTVACTPLARLIYLGLFQRVGYTRIVPPGRYARSRLRRPGDLRAAAARAGLPVRDVVGFEPRSPISLVRALLARRALRITDEEIAPRAGFVLARHSGEPPVTYFAVCERA